MTPKADLEHDHDMLQMYLEWALRDAATHPPLPLPRGLVKELEAYGKAKAEFYDRQHMVQIMQQLEYEGLEHDKRYAETARRLGRFRGTEPNERLIRSWWEKRKTEPAADWLDDEHMARKRGRPRKSASKK